MKKNQNVTLNHAEHLNEGRVSQNAIRSALRFQTRYYTDIAHILTVAATANYLDGLDKDNLPALEDAAHGLLQKTVDTFKEFNEKLDEILAEHEGPLTIPEELTPYQVAKLMMSLCHIRLVVDRDRYEYFGKEYESDESPDNYAVMLYVADKSDIYDGQSDIGTYTSNFWPLIDTLSSYSIEESFLTFASFAGEVEFWLRVFAKKVGLSYFQGFVPLENGVLNCKTKEFMPFSPEYVFNECTYGGFYEEGEDGPVIRFSYDTKMSVMSVDDYVKGAALGSQCE